LQERPSKVSPTGLPKSVTIEQILRQRILGECRPDEAFSPEPKLSKEFRVKRTLIRGVLGNLAREGLISREARHGAFVLTRLGEKPQPEVSDLIERLLDRDDARRSGSQDTPGSGGRGPNGRRQTAHIITTVLLREGESSDLLQPGVLSLRPL
jgi:DNA-binding transcriptional regulator YhcF (GntR family)